MSLKDIAFTQMSLTELEALRAKIERLEAALADAVAWHEAVRGNEPGDSPRVDRWRAALAGKEGK